MNNTKEIEEDQMRELVLNKPLHKMGQNSNSTTSSRGRKRRRTPDEMAY